MAEKLVASGRDTFGIVAFISVEGVHAWADANGGEHGVRELLANQAYRFRAFDTSSVRLAQAWLEIVQRNTAMDDARTQRGIAERSAAAAERSAQASEKSARWAAWAIAVSILSIIVSGWDLVSRWMK